MKYFTIFTLLVLYSTAMQAQFSGGTGTSGDPYLISSVTDLATLATNINAGTNYSGIYFQQTTNLDLNVSHYNTGTDWPCIGNSTSKYFSGTYDGNGYTISNLYINNPGYTSGTGLFGGYFRGTVLNLGLLNASVSSTTNNGIAALVRWSMAGNIREFFVTGCTVSGYSYVVALVGSVSSSLINRQLLYIWRHCHCP